MIDQLLALIVDESKWLPASMLVALLAVAALLGWHAALPGRRRALAALHLFGAVTLAVMALGHTLAVTVKLHAGTLKGSPPLLYLIGAALTVPAWWLIVHTRAILVSDEPRRATLALNGWMAVTLLALGVRNLPLAVPFVLTIAYQLHARRAVGWAIVGVAVVFQVGLFIGAMIFLASGQTFEQFRGME